MNDPYKILGVSPNSTEDEINSAYKQLLSQINREKEVEPSFNAAEKINELNSAYDAVMDIRKSDFTQQSTYAGGENARFSQVREFIRDGKLDAAESQLHSVPIRNAEWSFLMGTLEYARGHLNQAYVYFSDAVKQNPNNPEYSAALSRMSSARQGKMPGDGPYRTDMNVPSGCGLCNICNGLICADCCCECFGGDLIPCC